MFVWNPKYVTGSSLSPTLTLYKVLYHTMGTVRVINEDREVGDFLKEVSRRIVTKLQRE